MEVFIYLFLKEKKNNPKLLNGSVLKCGFHFPEILKEISNRAV